MPNLEILLMGRKNKKRDMMKSMMEDDDVETDNEEEAESGAVDEFLSLPDDADLEEKRYAFRAAVLEIMNGEE